LLRSATIISTSRRVSRVTRWASTSNHLKFLAARNRLWRSRARRST
jgi:hypothetical protein